MSAQVRAIASELHEHLKKLYRGRLVRMVLFGSRARGDATPGSDIDILVVLQGPVNPGEEISRAGEITAALSLKHDVVISCTFLPSDRFETEQSPLLLNVRREGVTV